MTINETVRWLSERDNFLVLTHRRPDGDTLGSAAGLVQGLAEIGKSAYILYNPEATTRYTTYVEKHWAPENYRPSYIISVDTASVEMLPANAASYHDSISLCIDHHPSNTNYAALLCLDASKASCGEIIYEILLKLGDNIGSEAATSLYVAVSTDTGCFAYGNTTANSHRVASELIEAGAPIGEINRELFRKKAKSRILLEAKITDSMAFYYDGAVAISIISNDMMAETGAGENDMDDVAAIPGGIEDVIVGITIRELSGLNDCKVSVRTTPLVDANALCKKFGGGGHSMAAGFTLEKSADYINNMLLDALSTIFPIKEV